MVRASNRWSHGTSGLRVSFAVITATSVTNLALLPAPREPDTNTRNPTIKGR
jgi:hypothetical protein